MPGSLIWHDVRLQGQANPAAADRIVAVDENTPLHHALATIGRYANSRHGLDEIQILCHGYEKTYESAARRQSIVIGGYGLQLCREDILHTNVQLLSALKGLVSRIVVHSCAAADTTPELTGTNWDGQRLMGEMAYYTQATVLAADVTQYYFLLRHMLPNACTGFIDFRGWEGTLWRFTPDMTGPTVVESHGPAPR